MEGGPRMTGGIDVWQLAEADSSCSAVGGNSPVSAELQAPRRGLGYADGDLLGCG
jgi:hypothetical protein